MDQLPPHSPDAERGVIGCLFVEAETLGGAKAGAAIGIEDSMRAGVSAESFFDLRHRELFQLAKELYSEGKPFDLLLVTDILRSRGRLEAVGGLIYLNQMIGEVPSASNLPSYLERVREQETRRSIMQACAHTITAAGNDQQDVVQLVSNFEAQTQSLTEAHVQTGYRAIADEVPRYIANLEARRGRQTITGIETPWWYLNNMTAGLQPHELIIIGARPSTGKTVMGTDILRHACAAGKSALFISIEMTADAILNRMVAAEARVDGMKLRNGFCNEDKEAAVVDATGRVHVYGERLLIDDRSFVTGEEIWVAARRAYRQHKIDILVIDYLQLIRPSRDYRSRTEEVGESSAWLKRISKELPIPVVALAQLNRDIEKDRVGREPTMADLRESGNVEQDADMVALLWKPKLDPNDYDDMKWLDHHQPDNPKGDGAWAKQITTTIGGPVGGKPLTFNGGWKEEFARVNITVAKNRNGPTGPCELLLQKRSTRFVDLYSPTRVREAEGLVL